MSVGGWVALAAVAIVALLVDLRLFAPGRAATIREGIIWSIGWIVFALLAGVVVAVLESPDDAVTYLTVYAIERSLSLDNLFVFLLLFGYFQIAVEDRGRLLFWGIIAALVLRGAAILGGVALLERFSWVTYLLGVTLIALAIRVVVRSDDQDIDPERSVAVRVTRKVIPRATPFAVCLVAIVTADIAFAVDSIPAAFGITRDSFHIWMGNVFALVGLRSLFVLVRGLIRHFRYLNQTIGAVLGLVGVKLLLDDVVHVGPVVSLATVFACLAIGGLASWIGDRRDPEGAAEREAG
ncbi:MAG: tellurite resistance protein TerC [Solirubrobacteraceae bacterium]|nr:tellurite resistance protein TerC [Solirubrobacteraceae bacterium]